MLMRPSLTSVSPQIEFEVHGMRCTERCGVWLIVPHHILTTSIGIRTSEDGKYMFDSGEDSPLAMQDAVFREKNVKRVVVANPLIQVINMWV